MALYEREQPVIVSESKESTSSKFSKYLEHLQSIKCNGKDDLPPKYKISDLIAVDLLSESLCGNKELIKMQSFPRAINSSFQNGKAKLYCYTLAQVVSEDLCDTTIIPRDTFLDDFLLSIDKMETTSETYSGLRSGSQPDSDILSDRSTPSTRNRRPSSSKHLEGNQSSDMTVASNEDSPLVIFECKRKFQQSDIEDGIAQLVSYGMSLRDKKQVGHEIKLVLMMPGNWYLATLPPYKRGPENNLEIDFVSYGMSGMLVDTGAGLFLDRKAYITFLLNLRQHFQLVKSFI